MQRSHHVDRFAYNPPPTHSPRRPTVDGSRQQKRQAQGRRTLNRVTICDPFRKQIEDSAGAAPWSNRIGSPEDLLVPHLFSLPIAEATAAESTSGLKRTRSRKRPISPQKTAPNLDHPVGIAIHVVFFGFFVDFCRDRSWHRLPGDASPPDPRIMNTQEVPQMCYEPNGTHQS